MPLDAVCLSALCQELQRELTGARIDKIQQPERDLLLFSLRCNGVNRKLLLSAGGGTARIHFTENSYENPSEPPMFCMLLRKHLIGARILSVTQPQHERLLILELDSRNELDVHSTKKLVVEMMGRSANLILVDSDGRILDCIRRSDSAGDTERHLLPGMLYRLPPSQNKLPIFSAEEGEISALVQGAEAGQDMAQWILQHFSGLSPLLCRELAEDAGGFETLPETLLAFQSFLREGKFVPTMLLQDAKPMDFSFLPIRQYGNAVQEEHFPSFSELLDAFYFRRDKAELQRRKSQELTKTVRSLLDRLQRKLSLQMEELRRSEGKEEVRKRAELITANIYKMKKGDRVLRCQDYYEADCPEIEIPLDSLKSPQQNAAALFKEYNKLKGAEQHLGVLIAQGQEQAEYLGSVLSELQQAESEKDIAEIRRELILSGYIRPSKNARPEKLKAQQPHCFLSDDGFEILVGRNNTQNDELSFKIARRTDYWLHTQKVHGSHVILRCESQEPPARTLEQAAALAVYYSQSRGGGKIPVDYTMVRNLKKPSGALPGKVIYHEYRTMMAVSDEELVQRIKKGVR